MMNEQQERAVIWLAGELRPKGARRWDEAGIAAFVAKRKHLAFHEVLLDVIACALDPKAETPAVLGQIDWRARLLNVAGTKTAQPIEPFDRGQVCHVCNQPEDRCRRNPFGDHEYISHADYARQLAHDPRRARKETA